MTAADKRPKTLAKGERFIIRENKELVEAVRAEKARLERQRRIDELRNGGSFRIEGE